jgi:hypothetical protein
LLSAPGIRHDRLGTTDSFSRERGVYLVFIMT